MPRNRPPIVYLVGYRATGKSTVGRKLAAGLGWDWFDTDEQIQQLAGCTIAEIFRQQGERAFRDLESRVVQRLAQCKQAVVSLGGGAIIRDENRECVRQSGFVIWLRASLETIEQRLTADFKTESQRPNLTTAGGTDEIRQLLQQREPIYQQCSHVTIDTESKTVDEVVQSALAALKANQQQ